MRCHSLNHASVTCFIVPTPLFHLNVTTGKSVYISCSSKNTGFPDVRLWAVKIRPKLYEGLNGVVAFTVIG